MPCKVQNSRHGVELGLDEGGGTVLEWRENQ